MGVALRVRSDGPLVTLFAGLMLICLLVSGCVPRSLTEGLVGHWTFDEKEGTTAADSSDRGHSGTLRNGAVFQPGVLGNALVLNGEGALVEVADSVESPDFDLKAGFTFAVWIRPSDQVFSGNRVVVSKDRAYELRIDAPFQGAWDLDLNTPGADAETHLQVKTWQHIAATWDGDRVRYYYNGQPDGGYASPKPLKVSRKALGIGARPDGNQALRAQLDDLRIYDRALSPAHVADLYALAAPTD